MIQAAIHGVADQHKAGYQRTVFVDAILGNDSSAAPNNAALPFMTFGTAVDFLAANWPGVSTTVRMMSDVTSGSSYDMPWQLSSYGLKIKNHDASPDATNRVISLQLNMDGDHELALDLERVTVAGIVFPDNPWAAPINAGTIFGSNGAQVTSITANGVNGSNGIGGSPGTTGTGNNGNNGPAPSGNGEDGQSWTASGTSGTDGLPGGYGRDITLSGDLLISSAMLRGGVGGNGGVGGIGNVCVGGTGGMGAPGFNDPDLGYVSPGGNGGNGGNAIANGGNGGVGAGGGNGGNIHLALGAVVITALLEGGAAGTPGTGGAPGSASAGGPGSGGDGSPPGNPGNPGISSSTTGSDGSAGSAGTNGAVS